jgi:hypothetical protein
MLELGAALVSGANREGCGMMLGRRIFRHVEAPGQAAHGNASQEKTRLANAFWRVVYPLFSSIC